MRPPEAVLRTVLCMVQVSAGMTEQQVFERINLVDAGNDSRSVGGFGRDREARRNRRNLSVAYEVEGMSGPAVNQRVVYRSFAGDSWDAVVIGLPLPGFVDLWLEGLGIGADGFLLRSVRWYDDSGQKSPGARPNREGLGV